LTVGVVGLGYVGLPLAIEFGKRYRTLGFDRSEAKVAAYKRHIDPTGEIDGESFAAADKLVCSTDPSVLAEADFVVVAVPTPVDAAHNPELSALVESSRSVGRQLKRGAVVVYESTVYPGATEEVCIPLLGRGSPRSLREIRRKHCDFWKRSTDRSLQPASIRRAA
jgi:UDP-N-acetyl-D-galactosamine dehydrogenase